MTHPKSDKPLRPDLQQVLESRAAILDDARPKAVAQQRKRGRWTAREGIAALVDPRQLRRIWRPCAAGRVGHDRRRRWRGHGHGADRRPAGRPADLRLHGLCRHAERHQPHEDDPHVRACRAPSPAGGVLARRRRRAAARHEGRGPRRHAHLRGVRTAVGPGADDRHPARPRLRRPRQPRRHVRRADRHQGFHAGHGRPAARRGGAGRQADARGDRPGLGARGVGRHRRAGRGRGRGRSRWRASISAISAARSRRARRPTARRCAMSCRTIRGAPTMCAR